MVAFKGAQVKLNPFHHFVVSLSILVDTFNQPTSSCVSQLKFTRAIISYLVFVAEDEVDKASLENMPANLYESVCVPDLDNFLGYQGANNSVTTPEHKSPATPASSTTSTSSGPRNPGPAQSSIQQTMTSVPPLPPRAFDGEFSHIFF